MRNAYIYNHIPTYNHMRIDKKNKLLSITERLKIKTRIENISFDDEKSQPLHLDDACVLEFT